MNPINATGGTANMVAAPQRVFLSHTSDLGKHTEPGSFVARRSRRCSAPAMP